MKTMRNVRRIVKVKDGLSDGLNLLIVNGHGQVISVDDLSFKEICDMKNILEQVTLDVKDAESKYLSDNAEPKTDVDKLKKELANNDTLLDKNINKFEEQVQIGLYRLGYPTSYPRYDILLDRMSRDIRELKMRIDSKCKVINPLFVYQTSPDWVALELENAEKQLQSIEKNKSGIEDNISRIKSEIVAQNERLRSRREQILDDLSKLGEDVSCYRSTLGSNPQQDYIG